MFDEIVKLYETGEKPNRIKADGLAQNNASSFELSFLKNILADANSTIQQKMAASLAIGFHGKSGQDELLLLFNILSNSKGLPTNYSYRLLSGIRKILSNKITINNIDDYFDIVEHFRVYGGKDSSAAAKIIQSYMTKKPKSTTKHTIFSGGPFEIKDTLCFIITPFVATELTVFNDHIKPVAESLGFDVSIAKDIFSIGVIIDEIWAEINQAKIIIANITGRNANVYYEVGLAHAIDKELIMICDVKEQLPFDILHRRVIQYECTDSGYKELEDRLKKTIENVLKLDKKA